MSESAGRQFDSSVEDRWSATLTSDKILVAGLALAALGLLVPAVPFVWSGEGSWFGLPRSFVWVIAVLLWVFLLLTIHFLSDRGEGS